MAILTLMALAAAGCKKVDSGESDDNDKLPKEPVAVRAVTVERTDLKPSIDLVGSLVAIPERTTVVSPQIAGWIQKVMVTEGDRVRSGDELLHFDPRMAEGEVAKAVAAVDEKTAILDRLKHGARAEEIEMARHDLHKAQLAVEALHGEVAALKSLRSNNEVSSIQFQKIDSALQAAETEQASVAVKLKLLQAGTRPEEIAEAEAHLAAAKADLATARLNLQLCTITSSIEGTVTQLAARQGMYAEHASALATIVDLSHLFLQIRVPSAYLAGVKVAAKVEVRVTSLPEKIYYGTIARISGQADPATGDVDALVRVDNQDDVLRPGLSCRGRIGLGEVADATVVPVAALADRAGTPVLSVVREGKCYEVAVKVGVRTQTQVQILDGVVPGDLVITEGGYALPEGCPVQIRP
jgi:HlyD family secretion protein